MNQHLSVSSKETITPSECENHTLNVDSEGVTRSLHHAARFGHLQVQCGYMCQFIDVELQAFRDIYELNFKEAGIGEGQAIEPVNGDSLMHTAVRHQMLPIIRLLLSGPEQILVFSRNYLKQTPLHVACGEGG